MSWKFWKKNRYSQRHAAEINIWRLQALFNNFRRILILNNAILEEMAHMERTLGGEFIFDRIFLENSVRAIASRVHHVTYNLNALTGNAYIPLYDRYQAIRTTLDDVLSGNFHALACPPVLFVDEIGWELEQLVGIDLACLAELCHHPGIQADAGFVITTEGIESLCENIEASSVRPGHRVTMHEVRDALRAHFARLGEKKKSESFSVVLTRIDHDVELIRELAVLTITFSPDRRSVEVWIEHSSIPPLAYSGERVLLSKEDVGDDLMMSLTKGLERILRVTFAGRPDNEQGKPAMFVAYVRGLRPPALTGTVRTRGETFNEIESVAISSMVPGEEDGDTLYFRRTYPFDLLRSEIIARPQGFRFADGQLATGRDLVQGNYRRGSVLLEDANIRELIKASMMLERMLGTPVIVEWERNQQGVCLVTRLIPVQVNADTITSEDLQKEREGTRILCKGGQMVQLGVAAGHVVHVTDETDPEHFPPGGIAVARSASPQLTPILQQAAALITEFGTATGHLATVARELRLPAIFGVSMARTLLPEGAEVTVDAGEATVYRGVLELLLQHGAGGAELSPADMEYRILRCLLRFIMPLNLIDPEAPSFTPAGCRTFHDIIHFSHEKAIDELAHFQEHRPEVGAIRTRRMRLKVPMDIRVLDIGGGMVGETRDEPVRANIRSAPFSAFLDGLLQPEGWAAGAPSLGLRDIISGMPRSMGLLSGGDELLAENLAIISYDYLNLSLRLGYHFSVIDSHLGSDGSRDYVYFRFAGGLADPERRNRRAKFISQVLAAMDFKVSVKGDLVIGRLKLTEPVILRSALFILGGLTAFSRQRDTGLYSDADTTALFKDFCDAFLHHYRNAVTLAYEQQLEISGQTAMENVAASGPAIKIPSILAGDRQ